MPDRQGSAPLSWASAAAFRRHFWQPPGVLISATAAMVLSLSVAVGVLALVLLATSLADWRDLAPVYRRVSVALGVAAVVALLLGWLAPPPWLQILLLTVVLFAVWLYGILTWFSFTRPPSPS